MADRVGQQLGNYRLIRLLGRGGFADVYLGEHVHIDTLAAIKVLHTQLTSEDVEKFRTEARTLARLVHPQIVRLLDFGIQENTPFLVMDYAPNGSLRQRYPKGTILPLTTIVLYVTQIAEALQFAHDEKLIHRDIKPENIFLGRRNEVVLGDFGIAVLSRTTRSQSIEEITGTVAYMAPEQLQGRPSRVSDQYSLGIVVYEWVSGDVPFHGAFVEIASQHMLVPPPPLREKIPTFSPMVEQVVLKALEKEPQKRFASTREFAQALTAVVTQPGPVTLTIEPTIIATPPRIATPVPQKTKKQWLDEGDAHHDAGRYQEAIKAYYYVLQLDSQDAEAYFNRGNVYLDLKEYRRAITDYDRAIQIDPNYVKAYYNRGNTYFDLKEYQKAIANYDRATQLDPKDPTLYYNRGNAYSDLKEYQKAIADYNRAIALDSAYVDAYNNRGIAYFGLERYQKAIADYEHAIDLDPNDAETYFNRGDAYYALNEYQQAIADYTRAIALDPMDALAYSGRGFAYFSLKDYRRAIQDFDHSLQLDPNITWVNVARDEAYQMLKRRR